MNFERSETRENLMRAFAGESQARSRYTFAARQARREGLEVVARVFDFTAGQELAHARVFYRELESAAGQSITIEGGYPVDIWPDTLGNLKAAVHNELREWEDDYARFARVADEEGFERISGLFGAVAEVEKGHADRFRLFADLLEGDRLLAGEEGEGWMCLSCGQITHASIAPAECYVCRHGQGFFVRSDMAPFVS